MMRLETLIDDGFGGVFGLALGPSVSRSKTLILIFPVALTLVILRWPSPPPTKQQNTLIDDGNV